MSQRSPSFTLAVLCTTIAWLFACVPAAYACECVISPVRELYLRYPVVFIGRIVEYKTTTTDRSIEAVVTAAGERSFTGPGGPSPQLHLDHMMCSSLSAGSAVPRIRVLRHRRRAARPRMREYQPRLRARQARRASDPDTRLAVAPRTACVAVVAEPVARRCGPPLS
jgi:hypothetical protein